MPSAATPATPLVANPLVGVIMGSKSDYATMRAAVDILREFGVPYEARVVSAHRTPELMFDYAGTAASRGLRVLIAGAGGAAHLPGMVAARTTLPVLGVPIAATALQGFDALLSIVQMPKGIPVGTLAIGAPGAANAGLLAVQILATGNPELSAKLTAWRAARRDEVLQQSLDESKSVEENRPAESAHSAEPPSASKVLEESKRFNDPEPEVIR